MAEKRYELLEEKNLPDIFKKSLFELPKSKINTGSTLLFFLVLTIYAFLSKQTTEFFSEIVISWANAGFEFTTSILGFLIAGFSLFAIFSDKNMFVAMSKLSPSNKNISFLKYNLFALIYVFVIYLLFSLLCLLVKLLGDLNGILSIITFSLLKEDNLIIFKYFLIKIIMIAVGTCFFYSLILLQSFIYNVYHFVMTIIKWEKKYNQTEQN